MFGTGNRFILRDILILFFGVLAATGLLPSIQADSVATLILVALVLAVLNVILKPVLVLFTLPFLIFTFGLGILLINAVLLFLAGQLVPGFMVPGFGTAFLGALIISVVHLAVNLILTPRLAIRLQTRSSGTFSRRSRSVGKSDIIDV